MERLLDVLSLLFYHDSKRVFIALIGIVDVLTPDDKREFAGYLYSLANADELRELKRAQK